METSAQNENRDVLSIIIGFCDEFDLLKLKVTDRTFKRIVEDVKIKRNRKKLFSNSIELWTGALSQKGHEIENFKYVDEILGCRFDKDFLIAIGYLGKDFGAWDLVKIENCLYDLPPCDAFCYREGDMMFDFFGWRFRFNTLSLLYRLEDTFDAELIERCVVTFEERLSDVKEPYFFDEEKWDLTGFFWVPQAFYQSRKGKKLLESLYLTKQVLSRMCAI